VGKAFMPELALGVVRDSYHDLISRRCLYCSRSGRGNVLDNFEIFEQCHVTDLRRANPEAVASGVKDDVFVII
jgi:hypothetical protein